MDKKVYLAHIDRKGSITMFNGEPLEENRWYRITVTYDLSWGQ